MHALYPEGRLNSDLPDGQHGEDGLTLPRQVDSIPQAFPAIWVPPGCSVLPHALRADLPTVGTVMAEHCKDGLTPLRQLDFSPKRGIPACLPLDLAGLTRGLPSRVCP